MLDRFDCADIVIRANITMATAYTFVRPEVSQRKFSVEGGGTGGGSLHPIDARLGSSKYIVSNHIPIGE